VFYGVGGVFESSDYAYDAVSGQFRYETEER
jgi:hypothetical protein